MFTLPLLFLSLLVGLIMTNAGKAMITNRLNGGGTTPQYIAWGTGSTAEAATQTALVTPSAEARTAGVVTQQTTTVTNDTYRVVGTVTSLSAQTIQEIGLFDASTAGGMMLRHLTGAQTMAIGDGIAFTFNVQF